MKAREVRRPALAPEPHAGGRAHAGEHLVGAAAYVGERTGAGRGGHPSRLARQKAIDRLVENIVRRRAGYHLAAAPHEEVAVAHAGEELERPVGELLAEGRDAAPSVLGREVAGGVVGHHAVGHCDEVAAVGDVVRAELHAHGGGLQRASARVDGRGVVAEHGEVGHIAPRRHALRHGAHGADDAGARERIHRGRLRGLQRR